MSRISRYLPCIALSLFGCAIEAERESSDSVDNDAALSDDIHHGSSRFEFNTPGELESFIEQTMSPSFASSAQDVLENGIEDGEVISYGYCVRGCGGDGVYRTLICAERECYFEPFAEPSAPCC